MTTAKKIVEGALRLVNESSNLLDTDPYIQTLGFTVLVEILQEHRAFSRYLVPQIPPNSNADLREPPWATSGLKFEVAERLAPEIQLDVMSSSFMKANEKAQNTILIKASPPVVSQYPETLPIGSGNERWGSYTYKFYGENDTRYYDIIDRRNENEEIVYYADFDGDAVMRNTSVSSVQWDIGDGAAISIDNESTSDNLSQAAIGFIEYGTAIFTATALYTSGEIKIMNFKVSVDG